MLCKWKIIITEAVYKARITLSEYKAVLSESVYNLRLTLSEYKATISESVYSINWICIFGEWILRAGIWEDIGIWVDDDHWND